MSPLTLATICSITFTWLTSAALKLPAINKSDAQTLKSICLYYPTYWLGNPGSKGLSLALSPILQLTAVSSYRHLLPIVHKCLQTSLPRATSVGIGASYETQLLEI